MGNDHYVPQLLLRKFAENGKSKRIVEYSLRTGHFQERPISSVCTFQDLNSIDDVVIERARQAGLEWNKETFEKGIGQEIEDPFARVLHRIEANPDQLADSDMDWLGSYVAFQLVRTPWSMGRHVHEANGAITQREVLARMLSEQPIVFDLIKQRQWSLWKAEEDAGHYVLTDQPVQLMSIEGRNLPLTPKGLQQRTGVLTMPLTKQLLVRAQFDVPGGMTFPASRERVARYNYASIAGAIRHIYLPVPQFTIWDGVGIQVVDETSPRTYRFEQAGNPDEDS